VLRASYHVYGGLPLVIFTIPVGIVFAAIYQRSQRLTTLVIAHALYDGVLFMLVLANR
jgi:membrane protease YdiL (CAAX protease family)